jgi:hypothetical protein
MQAAIATWQDRASEIHDIRAGVAINDGLLLTVCRPATDVDLRS